MFGFINKLVKTGMDIIELPVAAVKDVLTLGGSITDQDKPYTAQKLEDIGIDYEEAKEKLDD